MTDHTPDKFAWWRRIPKLPIPVAQKCMLHNLATRAKPDGTPLDPEPYTSQQIAAELHTTKAWARHQISELEKAGYVRRQRIGRHQRHTIAIDRILTDTQDHKS